MGKQGNKKRHSAGLLDEDGSVNDEDDEDDID
jgi:hypothetical protein